MELIYNEDQTEPKPLSTAIGIQDQDRCPAENTMSEIEKEDVSKVVGASKENSKILITQPENLNNTSFNMLDGFMTDKDMKQWDCCDFLQPVVSFDGINTCPTNDSSAAAQSTAITNAPASMAPSEPGQVSDIVFSASYKSDDCHVAGLFRSFSDLSDNLDTDITAACQSDLYIFESEAHDFILSPEPNPQDIKRSQSVPLSQTVADISFTTHETCDSSEAVNEYDQGLSDTQTIVQGESDAGNSLSLRPAQDPCDVAQANAEVLNKTMRNDSPVELWLDACQYFAVEDPEDRNVSVQASVSSITSDVLVPSEETQRSGYSLNPCDMIGWSFDDKSWGPPVERWSSVDSWASALSDWAEIIASPAEDLTAAFTEIGAEIDALTLALAEVTTQIETELKTDKAEDVLNKSIMGVQDKPLDARNITESSVFTGQSCLIQEKEGIEPVSTRKEEIERPHSGHPERLQQSMTSSEVTTSEMHREEAVTGLRDITSQSLETDVSDKVILNIVEDTDWEYKRGSERLLITEPEGDKREIKDEARFSSLDLVAEEHIERICTPLETLNVTHQVTEVLGPLPFLNTLPPTNVPVPEENSKPSLNVHVLPNTLADFDGACQVEPLWGSLKFITPLAPLNVGSSLVTQASSSNSLNGDQEASRWVPSRDSVYDPSTALDYWPESDEVTDSSESNEDIVWPKQTDTNYSTDLKADEPSQWSFNKSKSIYEESRDLLNLAVIPNDHFIVCEEKRQACFTLDVFDPFAPLVSQTIAEIMPHKTHKSSSEGKTRSKKERPAGQPHGAHTARKQESINHSVEAEQRPLTFKENLTREQDNRLEHSDTVIDTGVAPQKEMGRRPSKKKKKHQGKGTTELLTETENELKTDSPKTDIVQEKMVTKDIDQLGALKKNTEKPETKTVSKDKPSPNPSAPNNNDDSIKKPRLSQGKFGKLVSSLESKLAKGDTSKGVEDKADVGATRRKAYSEVVKQKSVKPTDPKVVKPIHALPVSGDPQSLCLWCQFSDVLTDYTVTWRKDRTVLNEIKRSAGDESRVSLTISNASQKDLGKYQCELSSAHKMITLDFLLTYESAPVEMGHEEESVRCSRLMFKEDFLAEQYFGENHSASIVTEKSHFGEGMHRRAFRTTLQAGQIPLLVTGHPCVLKVHNAITYGTKNNEELVQKNFNLAVEECQVQNTAREYIKAYTAVAQSFDAFGPVPEIIPIYLVHRPSNNIPYATLEEELIGDFVKYSVKDGKEINLMRRDSEAGQKCCAFQHWVYHYTEGNLLVTDMQGVGMRLTDVGIATCKKGYKGFKGNCATSFIDQFKALHQCNIYCEILGLKSLQPKPKKPAPAPKSKAQPGATPKKKLFEPTVKGKS